MRALVHFFFLWDFVKYHHQKIYWHFAKVADLFSQHVVDILLGDLEFQLYELIKNKILIF